MEKWKDFELDCTNYLIQKFGAYATFIHQGGTDSTVPDILVKTISGVSVSGRIRMLKHANILNNCTLHTLGVGINLFRYCFVGRVSQYNC